MADMMRQKTERTGHIKTAKLDFHFNQINKTPHFMFCFSEKWARKKERFGFLDYGRETNSEKSSFIKSQNGLWPTAGLVGDKSYSISFWHFHESFKWRGSIIRVFVDSCSSRKTCQFLPFRAIRRMRELRSSRCCSLFVRQWFSKIVDFQYS